MGCVNSTRNVSSTAIEQCKIQDQVQFHHDPDHKWGHGRIIRKGSKPQSHSISSAGPMQLPDPLEKNKNRPSGALTSTLNETGTSAQRSSELASPKGSYNRQTYEGSTYANKQNILGVEEDRVSLKTNDKVQLYSREVPLPTVMQLSQEHIESNVLRKKSSRPNHENCFR